MTDFMNLFEKHLGHGMKCGDNVIFRCFRCDNSGTGHLYVNANDGRYYCFKCGNDSDGQGKGNPRSFAILMGEDPTQYENANAYRNVPNRHDFADYDLISSIYTYVFSKLNLSDEHRDYLISRSIDLRFGFKSSDKAFDVLRDRYDDSTIVSSGLAKYSPAGYVIPAVAIEANRILIPYTQEDRVVYFRSRACGDSTLKYASPIGVSANRFVWYDTISNKLLVITEGELKGMASLSAGVSTIATPGMRSSHETVAKLCVKNSVENIILCFDNQIENFRDVCSAKTKLVSYISKLYTPRIYDCVLPFLPMVEEGKKIDIDSFINVLGKDKYIKTLSKARRIL
jgi:DNA primase